MEKTTLIEDQRYGLKVTESRFDEGATSIEVTLGGRQAFVTSVPQVAKLIGRVLTCWGVEQEGQRQGLCGVQGTRESKMAATLSQAFHEDLQHMEPQRAIARASQNLAWMLNPTGSEQNRVPEVRLKNRGLENG